MHYFLRQFLTECWYCIVMKSNVTAVQYSSSCAFILNLLPSLMETKKKITKANKRLLRILKMHQTKGHSVEAAFQFTAAALSCVLQPRVSDFLYSH